MTRSILCVRSRRAIALSTMIVLPSPMSTNRAQYRLFRTNRAPRTWYSTRSVLSASVCSYSLPSSTPSESTGASRPYLDCLYRVVYSPVVQSTSVLLSLCKYVLSFRFCQAVRGLRTCSLPCLPDHRVFPFVMPLGSPILGDLTLYPMLPLNCNGHNLDCSLAATPRLLRHECSRSLWIFELALVGLDQEEVSSVPMSTSFLAGCCRWTRSVS